MDKTWNVLGTNLGNTLKCRLPCDLNATLELYNNYRNWMYTTEETIIDKSASSAGLKSVCIAEGFMDINEKCQKLPVIKTHHNPWGGGLQEDGTLQFPFPIYVPEDYAKGTIRISLGKDNSVEDVHKIVVALKSILKSV